MRSRFLVFLLFASIGCAFLGVVLIVSSDRQSLTLADLTPRESRSSSLDFSFDVFNQTLSDGGKGIAELDWRVVLYGAAALLVTLLALRVMAAAARMVKSDGFLKTSPPGAYGSAPELATARTLRLVEPGETAAEFNEPAPPPPTAEAHRGAYSFEELSTHFRTYAHGLTGKMMITFTGIVAAFGLTTAVLVYLTLTASLREHAIESAKITAVNVSDGAPGYLLANRSDGLRELLRKHVGKPGVAYVLVQNRAGNIFAHSFPVLPTEMQSLSTGDSPGDSSRRTFRIGENTVVEVAVPILAGRLGAVRVGVWKDELDVAVASTVTPLIKWIVLIVIVGIFAAIFLVWKINQPIVSLVRAAREISHGDLDMPGPGVADSSEYGELARALERMRSSVRAAMIRLSGEF